MESDIPLKRAFRFRGIGSNDEFAHRMRLHGLGSLFLSGGMSKMELYVETKKRETAIQMVRHTLGVLVDLYTQIIKICHMVSRRAVQSKTRKSCKYGTSKIIRMVGILRTCSVNHSSVKALSPASRQSRDRSVSFRTPGIRSAQSASEGVRKVYPRCDEMTLIA